MKILFFSLLPHPISQPLVTPPHAHTTKQSPAIENPGLWTLNSLSNSSTKSIKSVYYSTKSIKSIKSVNLHNKINNFSIKISKLRWTECRPSANKISIATSDGKDKGWRFYSKGRERERFWSSWGRERQWGKEKNLKLTEIGLLMSSIQQMYWNCSFVSYLGKIIKVF